jgi:ABC-type nitrate/sulfonate/bicarbonate transport system permease component
LSPSKTPDPVDGASRVGVLGWWFRDLLTLRKEGPLWESILWGVACVLLCFCGWWLLTLGKPEERFIGPLTLPSPRETFDPRQDLWPPRDAADPERAPAAGPSAPEWKRNLPRFFEERRGLALNTLVTLRRVALGFLLAVVIGVPAGVLAGCFPRFNSFLMPVVIFGRNIPLAAVLPLLLYIFQQGEQRKIMFIFIACVAFVIADTAQAIRDVADRYIDTAYTLGASRWQTIIKVLVPLAMPAIFSSFRVLFGLAFGYIMLAESIKDPDDVGGLGFQINAFQRRGPREYIYLIILIIPLVALAVDQVLFWVQRQLFPYVFGGPGWLQRGVRVLLQVWDDVKRFFFRYDAPAMATAAQSPAAGVAPPEGKQT